MGASIRGHMGRLTILKNNGDSNLINCTNVDVTQDSSFMRSNYVGQSLPEGDQAMQGFTGSADFEVKDKLLDEFIDAMITDNLNGIGVADYSFVTTEYYSDGTNKSYVYFDVQMKWSRKNAGLNEKITKRLEFQAAGRLAIN
jgi:hypothetical protein